MADVSILGTVDCCNMPLEGSWIDYMQLAASSWELADTSVEAYSIANNGVLLSEKWRMEYGLHGQNTFRRRLM